jgi:hypothetical protein
LELQAHRLQSWSLGDGSQLRPGLRAFYLMTSFLLIIHFIFLKSVFIITAYFEYTPAHALFLLQGVCVASCLCLASILPS